MSPRKRSRRTSVRGHTRRRPERLSIVSTRVLDGSEPLRVVAHNSDGTWQFLCGTVLDVDHLLSTHAHHLFEEFSDDLAPLRALPVGHLAERSEPGIPWRVEEFVDE